MLELFSHPKKEKCSAVAEQILAGFDAALERLELARRAFREARGPAEVDRAVFSLLVAERELAAVLDEAKRLGVKAW
ncbi:hypothetical protein [Desulfovirgula thermocuniculi]|uniref:hypothetical protein n=1 Tax=Desulfovirgula thermocuniculi TaxID=348842 RepID=UPI0003F800AE|nr:hypothetical protein [Desulfovirgula thermocuniculi]